MTSPISLITLLAFALFAASCTSEGEDKDGGTSPSIYDSGTTDDDEATLDDDDAGELEDGGAEAGDEWPDAQASQDGGIDGADAQVDADFGMNTTEMDATFGDDASTDAGSDSASPLDAGDAADGSDGASSSAGDAAVSNSVPCGVLGDLSATSGRIWDLGHGSEIKALTRSDDRLLSVDSRKYWALWDLNTRTILMRGQLPSMVNGSTSSGNDYMPMPILAGGRLAVVTSPTSAEVRRASDGALLATIAVALPFNNSSYGIGPANPAFGMAPDGSYVWVTTATGITAWDLSGSVVGSKAGDYRYASVFALPGELRVARGAAGANSVEKLSVTGGGATSASFLGTFSNWSADGERFFTLSASTLRVYRSDTVQQLAIVALPATGTYGGHGDWFWAITGPENAPNHVYIYSVADPSAPAADYGIPGLAPYDSGGMAAVFLVGDTLRTVTQESSYSIQLAAPDATMTSVPHPLIPDFKGSVTSIDAEGNWAAGGNHGVVFDGANLSRPLSCGPARSIAGAGSGRVAIATTLGGISLFELTSSTRQFSGNISLASDRLVVSRNGNVLAANETGGGLRVYSLPSLSQLREWPAADGRTLSAVSDDGAKLATSRTDSSTVRWGEILDIATGTPTLSVSNAGEFAGMSPSGSRIGFTPAASNATQLGTNVYQGTGTLIGAAQGIGLGWMDEDRVFVARYVLGRFGAVFSNIQIVDSSGNPLTTTTLPEIVEHIQPLDNDRLYAGHVGSNIASSGIYTATGAAVWSGPDITARCCPLVAVGAVAGPYVVHTTRDAPHEVVIVPY